VTAAAPVAPPRAARPDFPASRRDDVVDHLGGIAIADPYRWLEDATQPEVQAWMKAQDDYARQRLAALPGREALASRLRDMLYFDSISPPTRRGDRLFYSRKHKDKDKRIAYWKQGEAGAEHVLLDPNTWSTDGSTGLHGWSPSWDGKYVAYLVSEHNADESTMKVLEVGTGKLLPDTLPGTKFGGASWSADNRGFYYTFTPPASQSLAEADRTAASEVRYHRLGGDQAKEPVVYPATGHRGWFVNSDASKDGHWLLTEVGQGTSGGNSWFYKDLRAPHPQWTTLVDGVDAVFDVTEWRDKFYVYTNDGAPKFHVFAVDPGKPARAAWREIVAQSDATLDGISVVGGRLILNYLRSATSELEIHGIDGALIRKVAMPPLGTTSGMSGEPDDDTGYFSYTSYTEVSTIYKTSVKTGAVSEWARITLPIDTSKFVAEQVHYKSKDGTDVTMFLVHQKDLAKTGAAPTLLTGYGGFRVSETPSFSPRLAVLIERGAMIALPNLRGGGEYGEDWHRGGMMENKQHVFDDFIAAAHYLIDSGWTSPDKLAILGGSNGGLLMGATTVQAPELFKAVICLVPLLDMVRYHKFGLGAAWTTEYGSADDPAQLKALYAYSPYHHVREGVAYPAFLMMSSDHDDRVDPMHARKFTAALQAATSGQAPVWLRIEQNAGHGGADVVKQQVDEWADAYAFLIHQLKM
jgi:prolyl oligopeptidase